MKINMLARAVLVLALCSASLAVDAAPKPLSIYRQSWDTWTRTRPLSAGAITLLEEATERSAIVTSLLERIENTDLVVYVTDSTGSTSSGPVSYLAFVSGDPTTRYLIIRLDFRRLSPPERIAWLGHEIQHALEVAAAPDVKDESGLGRLYRRIGWESGHNRYETAQARDTGNLIRTQLDRREDVRRASITP